MKKTLLKALPMLLVGLLFVVQSYAQVYYVDAAAADDSGNGLTPVTAKRTINAAIALASGTATATINIAKGNYPENVVINKSNITLLGNGSGSNGNAVPVAPDAASHTIITGGAAGKGIEVSGARTNITIKGIAIIGYSGEGVYATGASSGITLMDLQVNGNSTLINVARGGIFFSGGANNVTVTGCAVQNNGPGASARAIGIWDGHKANVTITNNYVIFTNCCGIDLNDGTSSDVNISNNTLIAGSASSDSAIGVLGMKAGIGANIIAGNNITVAKRYGIEIKNPAGSGLDDESAAGAIIVKNNIINRLDAGSAVIGAEARDLAGIAVFRRSFTSGNPSGYVDVPSGVVIKGNTISGFQQPNANGEGYGIVVEGVKMTIANNNVSNCDVGIQRQAGNASNYYKGGIVSLPYPPQDADQAAVSNYFGRGNSPFSAAITLTGNTLSSNGVDTRDEFAPGTYLGDAQYVYNSTQKVNYVTINLGVEYATASDVLQLSSHTFDELVVVNKAVTIDGVDKSNRTITYTGAAITSGSITPALFKVTSPNVTIKNLTMNVDLTKIWSAIVSSGDVAGLTVTSNEIKAIRTATTNAAGYTDRNAIGINISGRTIPGVTNATNPSGVITVTNNVVSYTPDLNAANVAAFRAAVAVDNYNVFVEGNTTTVVNHDVTNRFQTTAGQSIVRNNTFNGGGVEFSEPNAQFLGAIFENNTFDYQLGGYPTFALVRFKNNNANKPFSFKNNQVKNHYWLMSLENFQNIDVEGNTFTPIKNASDYFQIISVNTKTISSSANTKLPLSANIIGNTFNGVSGAVGAKGIAFYNHDNASPQFGSIVIGAVGKLNTFNDNINHYLYIDNNNGNATKDGLNVGLLGYPEYGSNIGLTTTGYWATNIRADQNNFFVDGQLRAVSSLTQAQRLLLDAKIFDKKDDANVGEVQYYFPIINLTTSEGFATIQSAIDDADTQDGHVVNVDEGTYTLMDAVKITKGVTLQGNNNVTATKPVINGVGGVTSKALVEVDAANVTIKNFEFQIAQQGDALVGVSSTTTDNFNNLSIEDNLFKGMKGYATGYVWASYAMKLGRGSAGVVGGVLNNKINVVRNTISYNTPSTPELFGRGIYAFNTYGKIGGSISNKNTVTAVYALQGGELGGGAANTDFEFSHNDVPLGLVSVVGAEVGSHKINNNNIGSAIPNLTTAQGIVRMLEVKGSRTAGANIEVAANVIEKYGQVGIFIQRSNNVTLKGNTLTPFTGATAFNSIVFSSKEGTSAAQSPVTSENLTITSNTLNGTGGTGIAFWNHNGSSSIKPLVNAVIGGTAVDANTFSASLGNYISLDATASGDTENATMGTLYDVTQNVTNKTNIFPFTGDVNASSNIFGSVNTNTSTNFADLLAVKAKITDGVDNALTGYVNIQPNKAFVGVSTNLDNVLSVVPDNFTLLLENNSALYQSMGNRTITKAHIFDIDANTADEITFGNLTVNAVLKEVNFTDAAKVTGNFILTAGKITPTSTFTLNGSVTTTPGLANFINGAVTVNNINSDVVIPVGKGVKAAYVALTGATGTGSVTAEYFPVSYSSLVKDALLGSVSNKEYWSLTQTGTLNAKLKLSSFDLALSGLFTGTLPDAVIARYDNAQSKWITLGNSAYFAGTENHVTANTAVTDFGFFTFGSNTAVLPVKLTSFTAHAATGGALVKWSTASEENNSKFEIEKSFDGKSFFTIDSRKGQGNSTAATSYEFLDLNFKQSAYYRLVQVDAGGKRTTYTDLTKFVKGFDNNLSVVAYPNPVTTKLYVNVGSTVKETVKVLLTDLTGKTLKVKVADSTQPIELDVTGVATGSYILLVIKDSGNVAKKILKP